MKNLQARLNDVNTLLQAYQERYTQEYERLKQEHSDLEEHRFQKERGRWVDKMRERVEATIGTPDEQVFPFFDELCQYYLQTTPEEHEAIGDLLGQQYQTTKTFRGATMTSMEFTYYQVLVWLTQYARRAAILLGKTTDSTWLLKGLVAVALEETRIDYRDSLSVLGNLALAAMQVGINPWPSFQRVAAIADSKRVGTSTDSTQDFIANFRESAFFQEVCQS